MAINVRSMSRSDAYNIYGAITGTDNLFIQAMARAAIEFSLDIMRDMFLNMSAAEQEEHYGKTEEINKSARDQAINLSDDMIAEFARELKKEIQTMKFTSGGYIRRELKTDLKFD